MRRRARALPKIHSLTLLCYQGAHPASVTFAPVFVLGLNDAQGMTIGIAHDEPPGETEFPVREGDAARRDKAALNGSQGRNCCLNILRFEFGLPVN